MNRAICCLALCLLPLTFAAAKEKKKEPAQRTVTEVLDKTVSNLEREFVPAAEAMPEDKFDFAPANGEFKGVRNFGQQIKHVAAVNYVYGSLILGEKPPAEVNDEEGPDAAKSKAEILQYLKDSFAYVHKAVRTINEKNLVDPIKSPYGQGSLTRLGLAANVGFHGMDHYGQMVEYLRMNGIIPPASK